MKKTKEDLNSRSILLILIFFSASFIIVAFIAHDRG